MASKFYSTNDPEAVKAWNAKLYKDIQKGSRLLRDHSSENGTQAVRINNDLLGKGKSGDRVRFHLKQKIDYKKRILSHQTVEGNEQSRDSFTFDVNLEEYNLADRWKGRLSQKRVLFRMPEDSREALRIGAATMYEDLLFTQAISSSTAIVYGGTATAVNEIQATDKLNPTFLSKLKVIAETGDNGNSWRMKPVMVDGSEMWTFWAPPEIYFDLLTDPQYQQSIREAMERGRDNPVFRSAKLVWDNVICYSTEHLPTFSNGGENSDVNYGKCVFMGAEALVWAQGELPMIEEERFDYGREWGFNHSTIAAAGKPVFDSNDYAVIEARLALTSFLTAAA